MVTTETSFKEGDLEPSDGQTDNLEMIDPDKLDFSQYQPPMEAGQEGVQDNVDKGNGRKAVLELSGMVQGHLVQILANTGAGLSIVSDSFINKYHIPTKPTKTRTIHGVTRHQLAINSSASIQVAIGEHSLGVVKVLVADTADYDLFLGFTELRRLKPTIRWDTGQLEFKTQEQDQPPRWPPEEAITGGLYTELAEFATVSSLLPNSAKSVVTSAYDEKPRHPTIHGNEFVLAESLIRAALEDGPIGIMLLDVPPSSLPAFGFVPTGADKGIEMEVEVDRKVSAEDLPEPYQHLRDVFDEVEADKLPHHTDHDLHLEKYLYENLVKGFIHPSKSPARSPVLFLGLYEYLVMPFGLANALAHFQSFINHIFRDIIGVYVVVYLDDFLIFSSTEEEHVQHVMEVLTRLRSNRLFAKLSKCEFHITTVEFLGYIIKPTGIEMDLEKVQTFLGFANFYRRFIAHFAQIAKPLTSLVKPTDHFKKFELPEEAQQAFHKLIQAFTMAGVLRHLNYHLPTRLETDASDFAITGVLKQEHEGCWHPVAFYSQKMSSVEKTYKIHNKELLAVVACLTQWRHMLAGLPSQLADFDFVLQYRPGNKGGKPDALTRRADMQPMGPEIGIRDGLRQIPAENVIASMILPISTASAPTAGLSDNSVLVAPMLTMESIATQGLKELTKIFQPLDPELQEIHVKKLFEIKDSLWHSGGRLVIPKVTMPGKTNNRRSRSAREVDGQSLSVEHIRFMVMCHDSVMTLLLVIVDLTLICHYTAKES
ncbi:uncharacterized protein UDID_18757 [Ustilago sp. UG-2017a]|nr:uncharacterized protein UDID_18757 [Ustilago sp. UG-2017a]